MNDSMYIKYIHRYAISRVIYVSVPRSSTDPADQNKQATSEQDPVADLASEAGAGRFNQAEGPAHRPRREAKPPRWLKDYTTAR